MIVTGLFSRFLPYILSFKPVFVYFVLLVVFLQNIPWIDDFFWYYGFLEKVDKAASAGAFWQALFTPYNNHWHVVQRLIVLPVVKVTGQIPLTAFAWAGNLLYLVLVALFVLEGRDSPQKITKGVVASLWLFFQPVSFYNFFECAFFNLPVLLFAFLSIRAFSKRHSIWLLWAFLATFSNGNGILVWPVLVFIAGLNRQWRTAASAGLIFFCLAAVYLFVSRGASDGPGRLSLLPLSDLVLYFLQLVGSVDIQEIALSYWWVVRSLSGLAILSVFFWLGINLQPRDQTRWFFCLFVLMSMGIVTLTRREVHDYSAEVLSHYWMFPQLFLAGLFRILIDKPTLSGRTKTILLSAAILLALSHYVVKLPQLNGHFALKAADLLNFEAQGRLRLYPPVQGKEEYEEANSQLAYVVARGYYEPPALQVVPVSGECELRQNAGGFAVVGAELPWRMLSRLVLVEVTTKGNIKTYFPVDSPNDGLKDWYLRKKGRRVDTFLASHTLIEPLFANQMIGCRVVVVK